MAQQDDLGFVPDESEEDLGFEPDAGAASPPDSKSLVEKARDILPTAGGMTGAIAGSRFSPLGARVGAALGPVGALVGGAVPPLVGAFSGGAGAEGLRQAMLGAQGPASALDLVQKMNIVGANQVALELGGRMLMGTSKGLGKGMMAAALKATPEIAQTALREGITATKKGLNKLTQRWLATTRAEQVIAARAGRAGVRINPSADIADQAYSQVRRQIRGADAEDLKELAQLHNRFSTQWGASATPGKMLRVRKHYTHKSSPEYAKAERGQRGTSNVETLWNKAVAERASKTLGTKVPKIADPEAYRQLTGNPSIPSEIVPLKTALDAIVKRAPSVGRKIVERGGPAAAGGTAGFAMSPEHRLGGALRGAAVGAGAGLALSPQVMSSVAGPLASPALQQFLLNLPRSLQALAEFAE